MLRTVSDSLLMLLLLIALPPPLNGIYSEGGENQIHTINCNHAYLIISSARYYAPDGTWPCEDWADAHGQTANHCNNRLSCSIDTAPGAFFGDPCWGKWKKFEVHYECYSCNVGHYFVEGSGCQPCGQDSFTPSGVETSCTSCPAGKTVPSGQGASLSDCTWAPCPAAHYLDQVEGCIQCGEGTYSSGGTTSSCSNCPTGKTVEAGSGTSESDCTWIPCPAAHYLDQVEGCRQCSEGTYSSGGTTSSCYNCSAGSYRDSTVTICTKCAENSVTEQSGAASCTSCSAGTVSNEERTQCEPCLAGTHRPANETSCESCVGSNISTKGADYCIPCIPGLQANSQKTQCVPCQAGTYRDSSMSECQQCPENTYSTEAAGLCLACPKRSLANTDRTKCESCESLPYDWTEITTETQFPLPPGSEVSLKCRTGYTLSGDNTVTCQEGRTFSFTIAPVCQLETCTGMMIENFLSTNASYPITYGTTVTVTCDPQYDLLGSNVITCEEGIVYSHSSRRPKCVDKCK
ncbi:hypothetical protein ACHWQZ_G018681 [Mnemiopsis leidyi]